MGLHVPYEWETVAFSPEGTEEAIAAAPVGSLTGN